MKLDLLVGGRRRSINLAIAGGRVEAEIEGQAVSADAQETEPGSYSIIVGGRTFEVHLEQRAGALRVFVGGREYAIDIRDPRKWRRDQSANVAADGRVQMIAPMPGKVVRVLAKPGEKVESGQGILVVEAMKMQNEVRSPKSGTVERLLVAENQAVTAGQVLCVIV